MAMMNEQLWTQASELASRGYAAEVIQDELTDGSIVYIAQNPDLAGCLSQGASIEEAVANLAEARIDYIYSLLEDGLPIPEPHIVTAEPISPSDIRR